jgi:hypothetical protein
MENRVAVDQATKRKEPSTMRSFATLFAGVAIFALGCTVASPPAVPQKLEVKIKVDKQTKKTKIKKVEAWRKDRVEFEAQDGPVTIIIPDRDLVVNHAPKGAYQTFGDWFVLKLKASEAAIVLVPEDFPDNRHDPNKKREIWYFVICGEGADAYPGEQESPPRMIVPPRKR